MVMIASIFIVYTIIGSPFVYCFDVEQNNITLTMS